MPTAAGAVFGDRLGLAERFAGWLTGAGITRGLLGPHEADQIWERHLLNGVALIDLIPPRSAVIDLGSGAGLPGIPLLLARPDLRMVLVEPKARRATFLDEMCADLGLSARVVRARATPAGLVALPEGSDDLARPVPAADIVTARAVAPLAELGGWAAALLRTGGRLLAIKGASANKELARDRSALTRLGFLRPDVLTLAGIGGSGAAQPGPPVTVIAMTKGRVSRET